MNSLSCQTTAIDYSGGRDVKDNFNPIINVDHTLC